MRDSLDPTGPAFDGGDGTRATASDAQSYFQNPVLDRDFPDPAIVEAADGFYYVYGTQTLRNGRWINIQVARSKDLVHWDHRHSEHHDSGELGREHEHDDDAGERRDRVSERDGDRGADHLFDDRRVDRDSGRDLGGPVF